MQKYIKQYIKIFLVILSTTIYTSTFAAEPVEYGTELINSSQNISNVNFIDLPQNHWAYSYIQDMVNKDIISGYPDNKFRPNNMINRAEFATIIVKAAGLQPKRVNYSSFDDVNTTDWYSPYIETAKEYLTGYRTANGKYIYNPTAPALREDIAIAIIKLKGYDNENRLPNHSVIQAMFKDYKGISEGAKDYVALAIEYGLMSGYPDETFRPQNPISRAEAAALLWRAFKYGNDNKSVNTNNQQYNFDNDLKNNNFNNNNNNSNNSNQQLDSNNSPTNNNQNNELNYSDSSIQNDRNKYDDKFTVDTIVGGIGQGYKDGPYNQAKIDNLDSMVIDKDNNVYFLDKSNKAIRKFDMNNGVMDTVTKFDDKFNFSIKQDNGKVFSVKYDKVYLGNLIYNESTNSIYLSCALYNYRNKRALILYQINPTIKQVYFNDDIKVRMLGEYNYYGVYDIAFLSINFSDENNFYICSSIMDDNKPNIYHCTLENNEANKIDNLLLYDTCGKTLILPKDDKLLTLDERLKLTEIGLFPRNIKMLIQYDDIVVDTIIHNDKFYYSNYDIYSIDLNGNKEKYINNDDLIYNDGNRTDKISKFLFDNNGNIIIYDEDNYSIRRINL